MYYSIQTAVSDGSLEELDLTIQYSDKDAVHVYFDGVEDALGWEWAPAPDHRILFDNPVPSGVEVKIQRESDLSTVPNVYGSDEGGVGYAEFNADTIDENFKQTLLASQENIDATQISTRLSEEAIQIAESAVDTANQALGDVSVAVDTASQAVSTANTALDVAEGIDGKAQEALDTANNAEDVALGIDGKAQSALDNSNAAVLAAAGATSTANDAKNIAEGIDGKAQSALDTANAAEQTAQDAAALRQDLANPDKGATMVARGVVAVDSIADLLALPQGSRRGDLRYLVQGTVFRWDGSDFVPQTDVTITAFGIFPDTGVAIKVSELQDAVDFCASLGATLVFPPGHYFAELSESHNDPDGRVDIPSNTHIKAYGAHIQDVRWYAKEKNNIQFRGGRYYHKADDTAWIFYVNAKQLVFEDCHFDQELPATSASPWIYIMHSGSGYQSENVYFTRCVFTNRTNIHVWNTKGLFVDGCRVINRSAEDSFVLKAYKGRGPVSDIFVSNSYFVRTTGAIAAGTELGEDVRNIVVTNCIVDKSQHIAFLKPNNSVTTNPVLRGGSIYDVMISNIVATDEYGEQFVSLLGCRVSDDSRVQNVTLSNISFVGRGRFHTNAAVGSFRVNDDENGYMEDIKFHNISFKDSRPSAIEPGDTDIYGREASGYGLGRVLHTTAYTKSLNQPRNVSINNLEVEGILTTVVDSELDCRWKDVRIRNSVSDSPIPRRAAIYLGIPHPNFKATGIVVESLIETTRQVQRGLGEDFYGARGFKTIEVSLPQIGGDEYHPVFTANQNTVVVFMTAIYGTALPDTVPYTRFRPYIADVSGNMRPLFSVGSRIKTTQGGVPAFTSIAVHDLSNTAGGGAMGGTVLQPGETLVIQNQSEGGTGATLPEGIYTVHVQEFEYQ